MHTYILPAISQYSSSRQKDARWYMHAHSYYIRARSQVITQNCISNPFWCKRLKLIMFYWVHSFFSLSLPSHMHFFIAFPRPFFRFLMSVYAHDLNPAAESIEITIASMIIQMHHHHQWNKQQKNRDSNA